MNSHEEPCTLKRTLVSHQTTKRLRSIWLICFLPNKVTITPLKYRRIGLSSKLFQFPFQTAFCTDLNPRVSLV